MFTYNPANIVDCNTNPTSLKNTLNILIMSDNLESSAVITVKKTFNQFDRNGFSHHATNIIGGATV